MLASLTRLSLRLQYGMVHEYDKNADMDTRKDFEVTSLVIITFLYVLRTGGDASGFFLSDLPHSYLMKIS